MAGIPCGLHLIMGLPGEDLDVMLSTIDRVNELPVDTVKIHQLQLVRGTRMARDVESGLYDIPRFTAPQQARSRGPQGENSVNCNGRAAGGKSIKVDGIFVLKSIFR